MKGIFGCEIDGRSREVEGDREWSRKGATLGLWRRFWSLLTPKWMASFWWLGGPERVIWYVEVGGVIGTLDRCGG